MTKQSGYATKQTGYFWTKQLGLNTKGGKLRRIYIPKELQNEALSWLADKQQESGFIFLNKYGERITTRGISGQLKKLAVK